MREQAARGRYERARDHRSRRHLLARVLDQHRSGQAADAVAEIVASRPRGEDVEVVVVRHGRLAGSAVVPRGSPDDEVLTAVAALDVEAHPDPGGDRHAAERRLVRAWLESGEVRLLRVRGTWALPVAGGVALAEAVLEARRVERQVRRDREAMTGAKVARRTGDQTSSNQGLTASGASAREPGSLPSHRTRTR
jgi:DNA polymerase III subunit epsilon